MSQKKLITILATITIIAILSVSLFYAQFGVSATAYDANNMTVEGVLASDTYVLFPYAKENLIFGFSKYGELINGVAKQGLEYDGMDVFANPNVYEKDWSQGWFIDIHYADKDNSYKNVWAFAMYTDLSGTTGIGGDWKENCTLGPLGAPYGGRKTNAWATTDPIKVLYDGPRRFVAVTNTTLYRASTKTSDDALVSITITFVFDKDKKCVILFKDIKRLDVGKWGRTFQVEFSNRGQWDIGITKAPPSYAHFYDNLTTLYDYEYHDFYSATDDITGFDVAQMINKAGSYVGFAAFWPQLFGKMVSGTGYTTPEIVLSSLCTKVYNQTWLALGSPSDGNITFSLRGWPSADPYPRGAGLWSDAPMVFKNGVLKVEGTGRDYTWNGTADEIKFTTEPLDTDYITVVYKHQVPTGGGEDDMTNYVTEPKTPYVIGEWCFDLEDEDQKRQFRAVTVYGLTDRHDGDDNDTVAADRITLGGWSRGADVLDAEVQYYLNETFNPYDLYSAVHKQEYRWVKIENLTSALTAGTNYTLTSGLDDQLFYQALDNSTYESIKAVGWATEYGFRAAGTATYAWKNEYEHGVDAHSKNWCAYLNATDGYSMVKVTPVDFGVVSGASTFSDIVDFSFWYHPLSGTTQGPNIEIKLYNDTARTGWINLRAQQNSYNISNYICNWTHYTLNDIQNHLDSGTRTPDDAFYASGSNIAGVPTGVGNSHSFEWWTSRYGSYYVAHVGVNQQSGGACYVDDINVAYLNKTSGIRYQRVFNMEEDKLIPCDWDAYCSFSEKVLINGTLAYPYRTNSTFGYYNYTINFQTGNITFAETLSKYTLVKILYSTIEENEKGRYEWIVVGRNAATIDSAAAGYITEAFDSKKDIGVLMTGMDFNETRFGPYAPFVMGKASTGTRTDYYYNYPSDNRTGLRDDWCSTTAISSSNMIFMAGPRANLGTEYFNDFLNAFFAESEYVVNNTLSQANKILGLSCWNKTTYGAGYGVISVYKDLNGTIGLVFHGYDGQDFYYTCKWFWETGIISLQAMNRGVTDIILRIRYPTADPTHPTVSIVERLGTISEKTPHDC